MSDSTVSHALRSQEAAPSPSKQVRDDGFDRAGDDIGDMIVSSSPLAPEAAPGLEARMVAVDALAPNPHQPRRAISEPSVQALAASIRETGLLQPITVRRTGSREQGAGSRTEYQVVAGERRWRAARLAGLTEVPVIIRHVSDEAMLELALVENIQREDLNPIDRAKAYRQYCQRFRRAPEYVARRMGEDRTTVLNFMRLLELPPEVQDMVSSGAVSAGHARSLLGLDSEREQITLARKAVEQQLSVREIEEVVRAARSLGLDALGGTESKTGRLSGRALKSAHVRDMEARLERACGTKVSIEEGKRKGRGKIVIEYYSLDDFERVMEKLGVASRD